jgi:hypothetical protein
MKVDGTESFASMMARAKAAKSGIENEHKLLNERYDLSDRPAQGVTMNLGKPLQEGAVVKLPAGMTWFGCGRAPMPRLDRILQLMEQGIEEGRNAILGLRLFAVLPDIGVPATLEQKSPRRGCCRFDRSGLLRTCTQMMKCARY